MTQATAVKERPILFSGAMVQKILSGEKSQTRRVIKPQPEIYESFDTPCLRWNGKIATVTPYALNYLAQHCPYGQINSVLWVRETWLHDCLPMFTDPLNAKLFAEHETFRPDEHVWHYRATDNPVIADSFTKARKWRPSIFMPRAASRITLEITDVRVQRVQDITEEDAIAEGCSAWNMDQKRGPSCWTAKGDFIDLWDGINQARGYGWDSNCWVWAISFKVVQP